MKFVFSDSLDFVDPNYDFLRDRSHPSREPYWDDMYPHEIFSTPPYDGVLVSRAIVGDHSIKGKYTESQAMRFRRVGARKFLRFPATKFPNTMVMGDCGAFAYHKMEEPPFTPEDMMSFYIDGGFTHGCSVDHLIFDFSPKGGGRAITTSENARRYDITLENAREFLELCQSEGRPFEPLGVIQGWSPRSMADAASALKKMGYRYLAVGGMAPLRADSIKLALQAIRDAVGPDIPLHLLGFAKAEQVHQFAPFKIASFDTTSPLIRAFKDDKANFYFRDGAQKLTYYTALRIPQARENPKLQRLVKAGRTSLDDLLSYEQSALRSVRDLDVGNADEEKVLEDVLAYNRFLFAKEERSGEAQKVMDRLRPEYRRTLRDKPWQSCDCAICKAVGAEVAIFRASNRNKRRGMHNLWTYKKFLNDVNTGAFQKHRKIGESNDLFGF